MTLRGNNCFAELWDAAACPPWSCHVELGSSSASQPGVGELALTFSGVELILFFPAKAGLVWLTGPSFPFLLGPCKERVVWFFCLSRELCSSFPAFLSYEDCLSVAVRVCTRLSRWRAAPSSRPGQWKCSFWLCLGRAFFQPLIHVFAFIFTKLNV